MADRFTGKLGDDANSGDTWALRKLTISAMVALAGVAAGDRLIVGPGVYREQVTLNDSGAHVIGTTDDASTVTVTNESRIVTGAGTNFAAAAAGQQFFLGQFETQADGAYAAPNFTSAGANFQAGMVGYMIEVVTQGIYIIASVVNVTTITLTDVNGGGMPGAGPYTYYIVSGEGPYEIETIDTVTQLTLVKPWSGPDLAAMAYEIYNPIYLIGDVTGVETDGIGGVVRITGTDDDQAHNRSNSIDADTDDYWFIRGFQLDCCSEGIYGDACNYWTVEDCVFFDHLNYGINLDNSERTTIRRCIMMGGHAASGIYVFSNPAKNNVQSLFENLFVDCGAALTVVARMGGVTIKNCTSGFASCAIISTNNQTVGTGVFVHDCLLHNQCTTVGVNAALSAAVLGQIIEQYNNLWNNADDRNLVGVAANSTTHPYLPMLPLLSGRPRNPTTLFAPSEWDATRYLAGLYGKNMDLYGVHNEMAQTRRSWGCTHAYATVRSEDQFQGTFTGSLYMEDAMEQQFVFPVRENWDYTATVWAYLEANYAGNAPQMVVRQPGMVTVTATSTGAIGAWHQLSVTFTTGADMDWVSVGLKSRNTSVLANIGAYFQDLTVN